MTTPVAGFIFDMDDLLIRSTPIWTAAETHLLHRLGQPWTAELAIHYKGMNALDVAATIHRLLGAALPVEECRRILRDKLIAGFSGPIEPMPGAVELVRALRARRPECPLAVASGSPLTAIEMAMRRLEIHDCFEVILSSESVARGKPHPDVFLSAARLLKVAPQECIVFEDSLIGVTAARAAAMRCVAVPSGSHEQIRALADRVVDSLERLVDAAGCPHGFLC